MESSLDCQLFLKNYYHLVTKTAIIGMLHHSHHLNSVVALPEDNDNLNNLHPFCQAAQYFQALQLNPKNIPGYSWKDILSEVPVGVDFAFFA